MRSQCEQLSHATGLANILLVDDRPENLLALEAVLTSPDYRLFKAKSGEEALKCVLAEDIAVILLDVQMPGLDGFQTASLIKSREKSQHIPIIFVTAISQAAETRNPRRLKPIISSAIGRCGCLPARTAQTAAF